MRDEAHAPALWKLQLAVAAAGGIPFAIAFVIGTFWISIPWRAPLSVAIYVGLAAVPLGLVVQHRRRYREAVGGHEYFALDGAVYWAICLFCGVLVLLGMRYLTDHVLGFGR